MDPITASIMMALTLASSAYSAYSSFQMADYSEKVAKADAKWKLEQGQLAQQQTERIGRRQIGEIKSAGAASGVVSGGTLLDLQLDQMLENAREQQLALLTGQANAEMARASGREKAASHRAEGIKSILGGGRDAVNTYAAVK